MIEKQKMNKMQDRTKQKSVGTLRAVGVFFLNIPTTVFYFHVFSRCIAMTQDTAQNLMPNSLYSRSFLRVLVFMMYACLTPSWIRRQTLKDRKMTAHFDQSFYQLRHHSYDRKNDTRQAALGSFLTFFLRVGLYGHQRKSLSHWNH